MSCKQRVIWDPLPSGSVNRPGRPLKVEAITVHDTGDVRAGRDARWFGYYIRGDDAKSRKVSWHFTVDDKEIRQHIPLTERAWHTGTVAGNTTSIGIEICMHKGIDRARAEANAARLVAELLRQYGLSERDVRTHNSWRVKEDKAETDCPVLLGKKWDTFIGQVRDCLGVLGRRPVSDILEELDCAADSNFDLLNDGKRRLISFRPELFVGLPRKASEQRLGFRLSGGEGQAGGGTEGGSESGGSAGGPGPGGDDGGNPEDARREPAGACPDGPDE